MKARERAKAFVPKFIAASDDILNPDIYRLKLQDMAEDEIEAAERDARAPLLDLLREAHTECGRCIYEEADGSFMDYCDRCAMKVGRKIPGIYAKMIDAEVG